jgi:hypothetical protein
MIEWVKEEKRDSQDGKLDTTREIGETSILRELHDISVLSYFGLKLFSRSPNQCHTLSPFRLRDFRPPYLGRSEAMAP